MNETVSWSEVSAATEPIEAVDGFAEQARCRAHLECEAVEWAIGELATFIDEREVDLEPLLEYARRSRKSLPNRHDKAYEAMADVFDVDPAVYETYVFAYSELCEELSDTGRSEKHPRGCTNALVSRPMVDLEGETNGPLVLKNRDIAGRGLRPKAVVEQPPIDDYYGFLTVDTCGTISIFKGVNDQGLVAANTYIDSERDDIDPAVQLRNGTVIRTILEEAATVEEARTLLESYPTRRLMGQTLFLADETDAVLLEVDPVAEQITAVDDPVVTRTNHFVCSHSTETASSTMRRERAQELLADHGHLDRDDLWRLARDHEHGPGDDSICRHPEPEMGEHAFGQLTTASAALFEGGVTEVEMTLGTPCDGETTRCVFGESIPAPLRTGKRWLERCASQETD
ncbi:linear amide C-N hydrolase [Natronolimnobius sp. AArcel1]|uniref:C45 family autoproteolytic acyltransferase/hydolase n=1 Tax=Natronolimnobius sp. AArcel1 TaxID=1679093 RepID=UPI0013EDFB8E|nr:C45 family peptidase [Natronolimnobius sp. AArcel1]NGM70067.1 linear amide C-N hydrolase [Natronolimnobius sp. AArcel1]